MNYLIVAFAADGDCLHTRSLLLKEQAFHTYSEMISKRMETPCQTYMIVLFKIYNFGVDMIDSHEVTA